MKDETGGEPLYRAPIEKVYSRVESWFVRAGFAAFLLVPLHLIIVVLSHGYRH